MQTSTRPLTRVYRLHRQYTNTSDNPISTSMPQDKFQGQRGPQRPTQRWEIQLQGGMGGTHPWRDYRHSTETTCGYCGSWPHRTGEECKASDQECYNCRRLGHFPKCVDKDQTIKIVKRLQSNTLTWRKSPQTTFKVSTPPHTLSPVSKRKPQSSVSRLQPESIIFKARTQNISDPYG